MSEPPELAEPEALAAELALGLLTGPERAEAEARAAREPAFAAQVASWRERLQPLVDGIAEVAPSPGVWRAIARALPANDDVALQKRLRFWRGTSMGAMGLVAASLAVVVMVANRPPQVIQPPAPAPVLNASLAGAAGTQPLFIASYDPMRKALVVTSLVPPGADPLHVHQLWLIPKDGQPRSLGMVEPGSSKSMPMPTSMQQMVDEGAELAVSVEPPGGSTDPNGPSGPIAARGPLAKI